MNKAPRKLTLTRETLLPLQDVELGAVHGGTTPATPASFAASVRFCVSAARVTAKVSGPAIYSIAHSTQPVVQTAKKAGHEVKKLWHKIF